MAKAVSRSKRPAKAAPKRQQPQPAAAPTDVPPLVSAVTLKLPSVRQLTLRPARLLRGHWRIFTGITLIYGVLNVILGQGLAGNNATILKAQLGQAFSGHLGGFSSSLLVFAGLVGSSGSGASGAAGAYQLFLGLIVSLAIIWALRQVVAGRNPRIRDAYYKGMFPLIPFIVVLLIIGLQLLPMALGSSVYAIVISKGIAVHAYEKVIWTVIFGLLSFWSFYLLAASVFGLYIVTLPDMTPKKALQNARQLVRGRRWTVLRKILFLPLMLVVVGAVIMLPFILWLTPLASYVFFVLTTFALLAVHGYMYNLYRELLDE